jgi:ubiquinone/menaquinone biosynthesis C-methylase UbiE
MLEQSENLDIQHFADVMKNDWNNRARENAMWYINTVKVEQTDEEFYETARGDINNYLLVDMVRISQGRDPKSLRILEIGCGIGRMTRYLADIFGEVCGTDVSGEMIQQARVRMQNFPNVKVYETSGVDFVVFPDNHFDFIFSAYVFQHVPSADVVRSNILEAYRVLKPGGVFKFQVNSTVNPEYDQAVKDTWAGTTFPEHELRKIAAELDAQLISIAGIGGQYCWTLLRKRTADVIAKGETIKVTPRVQGWAYNGDSDSPLQHWGSHKVNTLYVTLFVTGIAGLNVDINQISVWLGAHEIIPCYVTDVNSNHEAVAQSGVKISDEMVTLVHFAAPNSLLGISTDLRVQLKLESTSAPLAVVLPKPKPALRIHVITNRGDSGVDVYATGPKSQMRIMTEGLDDSVTLEDLMIRVGDWESHPYEIEYTPSNGLYYVHVQLPEGTKPGDTEVTIRYQDAATTVSLNIQ